MRKKQLIKLIAIILAIVLIPGTVFAATDLNAAQKKKANLEAEKKKTESRIKELKNLKADVAAYVTQLDANLAEIAKEMETIDANIVQVEDEIEVKKSELADIQKISDKQYADMKLRIKYMYERGSTSFLDTLFSSENLTDLLNSSEYISRISEYDRAKLDEYEATQKMIEEKYQELEDKKGELEVLHDETELKQESVNTLISEKERELAGYTSQIDSASVDLETYNKEIKKQEDTIKAIEAEIKRREEEARKAAEAAGKKYETVNLGDIKFKWPCPSSGRITSYFGDRESPTAGASTDHKGIDIGASKGSDIIAAAAGEVIIATYSPSAGNYIMINHGGGVYTVYMHASELCVSEGAHVGQGSVIAKVGSTGYSTGPHLHFGIRYNGEYINPTKYVSP